jgi:hypothetical protein
LPEEYGGHREPLNVAVETYEKFNTPLTREMNYYLLAHFLLILGGTSFFLFNLSAMTQSTQLVITGVITFSIMTTGFLFEKKSWALHLEYVRLVVTGLLAGVFLYLQDMCSFYFVFTAMIVSFSACWLHHFYIPAGFKTSSV